MKKRYKFLSVVFFIFLSLFVIFLFIINNSKNKISSELEFYVSKIDDFLKFTNEGQVSSDYMINNDGCTNGELVNESKYLCVYNQLVECTNVSNTLSIGKFMCLNGKWNSDFQYHKSVLARELFNVGIFNGTEINDSEINDSELRDLQRISDLEKIKIVLINNDLKFSSDVLVRIPEKAECIGVTQNSLNISFFSLLEDLGGFFPKDPLGKENYNTERDFFAGNVVCENYIYIPKPSLGYMFGLYSRMENSKFGNTRCSLLKDNPVDLVKPIDDSDSCLAILLI